MAALSPLLSAAAVLAVASLILVLLSGCAANGVAMRVPPTKGQSLPKAKSCFIEGKAANGAPVSCSFVEFDERGDFLDFRQHTDCQRRVREFSRSGRLLVVLYCHGWKNNAQSSDVADFNAFLSKLAESEEMQRQGMRVHGIYLAWRGNAFRPYVETGQANESYAQTLNVFGEPIVDPEQGRRFQWAGVVPETLSYWNRKGAAEHLVSGLPMARAVFTYAAAAKDYGRATDNPVFVIGHSFGALMLERSLGQAMTGALTMEWWHHPGETPRLHGLPFDMVLFVNSAAPAIYAKEMRDFLRAHRAALGIGQSPAQDVPVIVSVTSTADWATRIVHPIGNAFAPLVPSLKREYTTGIVGKSRGRNGYPKHSGVRQSAFYTRTPGHQPFLINHWIVKDEVAPLPPDTSRQSVFSANLSPAAPDPDVFFTSPDRHPAAAWRITAEPQGEPVEIDGMAPAMADSAYWIVRCGSELIPSHGDVWSTTAMEMYAGLFRAVYCRRQARPDHAEVETPEEEETDQG